MSLRSSHVDFLSVKSKFICPQCDHTVTLTVNMQGHALGAALGVSVAVGAMATVLLSYILWGHHNGYSLVELFKTGVLLIGFTAPAWWNYIRARQYPVTEMSLPDETAEDMLVPPTLLSRIVLVLHKRSMSMGFMGAILIVVLFLGSAAFIGWINFTFFDDNLF